MSEQKRVVSVKPSPGAAAAGMIVAALFMVFGLSLIYIGVSENHSETGLQILIGLFGVIWAIACGAIFVFYVRIYRYWAAHPQKGLNTIATFEVADATLEEGDNADFEARLRKLEALKRDSLITKAEYDSKRKEITKCKW
ncbi:MAG: hypothetical protein U9R40_07650 [Synergistota bacterium]|nr:hypothetical protein [Synergistota bacterium]